MDNFFKSMRDQMENRPEPNFREDAWNALNKQLDEAQYPAKVSNRNWWAAAAILLLLGSTLLNFWFYNQLKDANTIATKETVIFKTDTVHHTQHTYFRDTIIQTRFIAQSVPTNVYHNAYTNTGINSFGFPNFSSSFSRPMYASLLPKSNRPSLFSSAPDDQSMVNHNDLEGALLNRFTLFYGLPKVAPELESPDRDAENAELGNITVAKRKRSFGQTMVYAMRPKKFYVGPMIGGIYPLHTDLNNQRGSTFGIQAAVGFSNNIRLWFDAAYIRLTYQTSEIESLRGVPDITPPGGNYTFVSASVPQPALQYSTGLQYNFTSGKWKPYLGAGFSTLTLLPFEVNYKFEDVSNDLQLKIDQGVSRKRQFSNHALFKFGLENSISERWSIQVESLYRLSLETAEATNSNLFGVRVGALYQF